MATANQIGERPAGLPPVNLPSESVQRVAEDEVIAQAKYILYQRLLREGPLLTQPQAVRDYLTLELSQRESEVFYCLLLDTQHRLIDCKPLFEGTIDGCSVYPREVVKITLGVNAAAVIFAHNHPSGVTEPSRADQAITRRLKDALELVDVRVLDHLIVGGTSIASFAEQGLL